MSTQTTQKINGLDAAEIGRLAEGIQEDSSRGEITFRTKTSWKGGTKASTQVDELVFGGETLDRGYTIDADEPKEILGGATAPNPQELVMAGLGSCMTVGYVALATLQGITLEKVEIEITGDLDLRGFLGLDENVPPGTPELAYTVTIAGDGTTEQFEEIHKMVQATSPNFYNLSRPVNLVPTLVVE